MPPPKSKPGSGGADGSRGRTSSTRTKAKSGAKRPSSAGIDGDGDGHAARVGEQIASGLQRQLDMVVLTRERIQDTLDEFAERGRVTRADANELVAELVRRGREQTDDILDEFEHMLDRGRDQIGSATEKARRAEPVDRIVRTADRARRTVGVGPAFPVLGYDDLTAGQVVDRLSGLRPPQLRKVRDYERRHANRKTVLEAIERAL
jgi:polyhydroxyalkanoate synthesis regulator phasin